MNGATFLPAGVCFFWAVRREEWPRTAKPSTVQLFSVITWRGPASPREAPQSTVHGFSTNARQRGAKLGVAKHSSTFHYATAKPRGAALCSAKHSSLFQHFSAPRSEAPHGEAKHSSTFLP
jgi:hypothetical protein